MFLCFGLLGLGVHLYKRYVLPRNLSDKKRMQVVERLNLSQKSALVLVKLDGREFLLATGSEGCRVVSAPRDAEYLFDQTLTSACEETKEFNA
jgi:flagellar biogenesis protein FliO